MGLPWEPTKGPKSKRLAEARFRQLVFQAGEDELNFESLKGIVPDDWFTLELDCEVVAPKEKVTLYLDRAVIRMFRAMGHGYQARINRLLETWLQMNIAKPWHREKEVVEWANDAMEAKNREGAAPDKTAPHEFALMEDLAWSKGFDAGVQATAEDKA